MILDVLSEPLAEDCSERLHLCAMQSYFYWWVILSFIWGIVAAFLAFFLPVFESRFIVYGFLGSVFHSQALKRLAAREMPDEYTSALRTNSEASSEKPDEKVKQVDALTVEPDEKVPKV